MCIRDRIATNGILVYPNPTVGVVNLAINSNQAVTTGVSGSLQASYNIQIVNNLGSVIKSATSTSANWQTDVSALVPGTYFIPVSYTHLLTMSAAGVISGTPTAASAATTYTITATGADGGVGTATVRISVVLPPAFTLSLIHI